MIEVGQQVRGKVEKLVFGGKGLIRHDGWVIFVADVIAGEEVDVVITVKKKSYFEARLLAVVVPSSFRVTPPCPYFGRCGGCQLQHIDYQVQLESKKAWLLDALERGAKITVDFPIGITSAKKQWGYRRKITLHEPSCGFYARDNTTIIPIDKCVIFSNKGFDELRALVYSQNAHPIRVTVLRNEQDDFAVRIDESKKVLGAADLCEQKVKELHGEELQVYFSPNVFIQNDPDQALQIYQDVLDEMKDGPILDLYCGVGVLSLLAAKRGHKVLGVELDREAIELAKKSATVNKLEVEFQAKPCEQVSKRDVQGFDQWIVNPPRTGLSDKVIEIIVRQKPKVLVYISCMPSTLARDLKVFYENGYLIRKVQVYDMFAQTTHLETVVYLEAKTLEVNTLKA